MIPLLLQHLQLLPQDGTFNNIPKYMKILVPHDRSEMSDKALSHAIYLARLSDAEPESGHTDRGG
jgi:hypothetical protein